MDSAKATEARPNLELHFDPEIVLRGYMRYRATHKLPSLQEVLDEDLEWTSDIATMERWFESILAG